MLAVIQGLNYNNFNANHERGYATHHSEKANCGKVCWKGSAKRYRKEFGYPDTCGELQLLSSSLITRKIKRYGWCLEREIDIPVVTKLSSNVASRWLLRRVKLYLKGVGKSSLSSTRINSLGGSSERDKSPQQIRG